MADVVFQLVGKAWNAPIKSCLCGSLRILVQPYLWVNPTITRYQVSLHRSDGFVQLKQDQTLFEAVLPLQVPSGEGTFAWIWKPDNDEEIWFHFCSVFEKLSNVSLKNSMCSLRDAWPELDKSRVQSGCLLLVFSPLPMSVMKALIFVEPQLLQVGVKNLNKMGWWLCERTRNQR